MSTCYHIDRESFEALLANAFAVQQSGLDKQSLASFVEIQQFIASERFDFDEEMWMVADRVFKLSNAAGVAIALLEANQLVYSAGAGSGTKQIGRRAAAVLNLSSSGALRQEILRVENAANDRRIEADICRQFGATSLLILPICEDGALRGILQVFFDDAHPFPDHEIRVYRLMAGALEEGILRRQQQVEQFETPVLVVQACNVEGNSDRGLHSDGQSVNSRMFFADNVVDNIIPVHGLTNSGNLLTSEQSNGPQPHPAVARPDRSRLWAVLKAVAISRVNWSPSILLWCFRVTSAAAVVLGLVIWISSGYHPTTSTGPTAAPALRDKGEPPSDKSLSPKPGLNPRSAPRETVRNIPEFRHVRINSDEVDDIAEDVTIRRFSAKSMQPQLQEVVKEVNLGDDVTVRYFARSAPAVFNPSSLGSENNRKLRHP